MIERSNDAEKSERPYWFEDTPTLDPALAAQPPEHIPDVAQRPSMTLADLITMIDMVENHTDAIDLADRIWPLLAAQPPAAPVETKPTWCPSVDGVCHHPACTCVEPDWKQDQADTSRLPRKPLERSSAVIGGVYGAKSLPPGVSIATANKAIEFLEWLSGYIGHGPAVQISSDQMEYIRSKVHPLVRELGATDPAAIDCPCNADCSAMPNGPLYNCPYLPENQPRTLNEPQEVATREDRLETERNALQNSYGGGAFKDGMITRRIAEIDKELAASQVSRPHGGGK